jgi:homoserine kinase type II
LSAKGIAEASENQSLPQTNRGLHFDLVQKRVAWDLPFFLGLMEHLAGRAAFAPAGQDARQPFAGDLNRRDAAIVTS